MSQPGFCLIVFRAGDVFILLLRCHWKAAHTPPPPATHMQHKAEYLPLLDRKIGHGQTLKCPCEPSVAKARRLKKIFFFKLNLFWVPAFYPLSPLCIEYTWRALPTPEVQKNEPGGNHCPSLRGADEEDVGAVALESPRQPVHPRFQECVPSLPS